MIQKTPVEHWFPALKPEEQAAAVALYREPLFHYASDGAQEMHILFVGTGRKETSMMDTFLRMSLIVGQMLGMTLHVHILDPEASAYGAALFASAPGLAQYASAPGLAQYASATGSDAVCPSPLVVFDFVDHKALNTADTGRFIGEKYLNQCRYLVVDLDKKDVLLKRLETECNQLDRTVLVLYTGVTALRPGGRLKLYSLDQEITSTNPVCVQLSRQAFRLHCHYERKFRAIRSMDEMLAAFTGRSGEPGASPHTVQYTNLTAVLHMKYKLASIGINSCDSRKSIMKKCARLLYGSDRTLYDDLSALEHRRWLMEKLLDGFHTPSLEDMLVHCYDGSGLSDKWWNQNMRFHNCLVSSMPRRESSLRGLTFERWEELSGVQMPVREASRHIAASGYDALDQASLGVHYLARQKMIELLGLLQEQLKHLTDKSGILLQSNPPALQAQLAAIGELQSELTLMMHGDLAKEERIFSQYQACAEVLRLSQEIVGDFRRKLRAFARLAGDYYSLRDYKDQDDDVVDLLSYVYIGDQTVILKVGSRGSVLDSVASSLLIEPEQLVLVDAEEQDAHHIEDFFRNRGGFVKTEYRPVNTTDAGKRMAQLKRQIHRLCQQQDHMLIVDLTGASGIEMLSVTDYIRKNAPKAAVITCDCQTQTIASIYNFPESACIRLKQKLHTDEVFSLIGACRQARIDAGDAMSLRTDCDRLWRFYTSHADRITEYTEFVRAMVNCSASQPRDLLYMKMPANPTYTPFQHINMPGSLFDAVQLEKILQALNEKAFIMDLQILHNLNGTVSYSGSVLTELGRLPAFRSLLELREQRPMRVIFPYAQKAVFQYARAIDRALYVNVEFKCGTYQQLTVRRRKGSGSALFARAEELIGEMQHSGAILESFPTTTVEQETASTLEENAYSLVMADPNMRYLRYMDKGEAHIYAMSPGDIATVLNAMKDARLIDSLKLQENPPTPIREANTLVSFRFTSSAVLHHLSTSGSFLESRIYAEAINLHLFDHVDTNYKISWNSAEHPPINEFDVLCVRGLQILLISAKATKALKEHQYEVVTMAQRLSHTAKPILIYASKSCMTPALITRARHLGILLAYAEGGEQDETIAAVLQKALEP